MERKPKKIYSKLSYTIEGERKSNGDAARIDLC
jgi:hypothetical protein